MNLDIEELGERVAEALERENTGNAHQRRHEVTQRALFGRFDRILR